MVKQPDEIAGCHTKAYIGIPGDTQILLNLLIFYPGIRRSDLSADLPYLCMSVIAAVRQAKLPLPVGLRLHRSDHFP